MQTYIEIVFDVAYLITVITLGIIMVSPKSRNKLFGVMALVLGIGDSFHLVPRMYGLATDTMAQNYVALGFGKLVTSVTMTVFYVLVYHFWQRYYNKGKNAGLTAAIYILAAARIILCMFPQNGWLSQDPSYMWGIYRNIPFALLGILIVVLFIKESAKIAGDPFRFAWLAVTLSFAFYIPVVLFADKVPAIGALMMPKTLSYVWLVWMGYKHYKKQLSM